jgi:hypothetical protein
LLIVENTRKHKIHGVGRIKIFRTLKEVVYRVETAFVV